MKKHHSTKDPVLKLAKKRVKTVLNALADAPSSADTLPVDGVHQIRVCTKNLRALLQMYRPYCCKDAIKCVDQRIKSLANAYADQRDFDVQYTMLSNAVLTFSPQQKNEVQPLLNYFLTIRPPEKKRHIDMDARAGFESILKVWEEKLTACATPNLTLGVDLTYAKAKKLAHSKSLTSDDAYHECRKWVKYYLYQLRLTSSKHRTKDKKYLNQLATLGDSLGDFHDQCVLQASLRTLLDSAQKENADHSEIEVPALLILNWLAEQKHHEKAKCHNLLERLFVHDSNPIKRLSKKS